MIPKTDKCIYCGHAELRLCLNDQWSGGWLKCLGCWKNFGCLDIQMAKDKNRKQADRD